MPYTDKAKQTAAVRASVRRKRAREREDRTPLVAFQRELVEAVADPGVTLVAVSIPRGNGKTWMAGRLAAESVTPGTALHERGTETVLVSASRDVARLTLEAAHDHLDAIDRDGWRWSRYGVAHPQSRTSVRVISSDSKRSLGLGARNRLIIADEPSAWPVNKGPELWASIKTARGKRQLTILVLGTLYPAPADHWWPTLIESGTDLDVGRYVIALVGDRDRWDDPEEIARVNPVAAVNPHLAKELRAELLEAQSDPAARKLFEQTRLNASGVEVSREPVITAAAIHEAAAGVERERGAQCVLGVDLGSSLSWCAAACVWVDTGRIELSAWLPAGTAVPDGLSGAVEAGIVTVCREMVPTVAEVAAWIHEREPVAVITDNHRSTALRAVAGCPVYVREGRATGASVLTLEDVTAVRQLLAAAWLAPADAAVLAFAARCLEIRRQAGGPRLAKLRLGDDVLRALMLAAGTISRAAVPSETADAPGCAVVSSDGTLTRYTGAQHHATGHTPARYG